jgi:hypothetical protein
VSTEHAYTILGVEGRMFARVVRDASLGTFHNQTWKATRPLPSNPAYRVTIEIRFDDECGNGHNSFGITGEVRDPTKRGDAGFISGGQCVDEMREAFPELAPLFKWHLVSSDGPMHYLANTLYHASDRDHHGLLKGETRQKRTNKGSLMWELVADIVDGTVLRTPDKYVAERTVPLYALDTLYVGKAPPATPVLRWQPAMEVGEGKARELNHARSSAVWPDATDEELTAPDLKDKLIARLPQLLADFRAAVEACGFAWEVSQP